MISPISSLADAVTLVKTLFESLNKDYELDELAELLGAELDKIIVDTCAQGATFHAGKMLFKTQHNTHFIISYELWFKKHEKWQKIASESEPKDLAQLKDSSRNELLTEGSISYTVTAP